MCLPGTVVFPDEEVKFFRPLSLRNAPRAVPRRHALMRRHLTRPLTNVECVQRDATGRIRRSEAKCDSLLLRQFVINECLKDGAYKRLETRKSGSSSGLHLVRADLDAGLLVPGLLGC